MYLCLDTVPAITHQQKHTACPSECLFKLEDRSSVALQALLPAAEDAMCLTAEITALF